MVKTVLLGSLRYILFRSEESQAISTLNPQPFTHRQNCISYIQQFIQFWHWHGANFKIVDHYIFILSLLIGVRTLITEGGWDLGDGHNLKKKFQLYNSSNFYRSNTKSARTRHAIHWNWYTLSRWTNTLHRRRLYWFGWVCDDVLNALIDILCVMWSSTLMGETSQTTFCISKQILKEKNLSVATSLRAHVHDKNPRFREAVDVRSQTALVKTFFVFFGTRSILLCFWFNTKISFADCAAELNWDTTLSLSEYWNKKETSY